MIKNKISVIIVMIVGAKKKKLLKISMQGIENEFFLYIFYIILIIKNIFSLII